MATRKQQATMHLHPNTNTAPSSDLVMHLADTFQIAPDLLIGNGNGIAGFGVQGAGKTGILARILEQSAQFQVPSATFDKEGDLLSAVKLFPRGILGTYGNCPTGHDILEHGLQVVYDLSSWPTIDDAGQAVAHIVKQLLFEASGLPRSERVPCLIAVDEGEYWLPQKRGSALSEVTFAALYDAFHAIATQGRKRGLTPVIFTQQMAALHKDVLAPGVFIFGRQTVDTSLKRYMEYIHPMWDLTEKQFKQRLTRLSPGRAIVKMPDGSQKVVQFYERESEHVSHTPKVQAAMNRYANKPLPEPSYGAYVPEMESTGSKPRTTRPTLVQASVPVVLSAKEQVHQLLQAQPDLSTAELAQLVGRSPITVGQYRHALGFVAERKPVTSETSLVAQRVADLLASNPAITDRELGLQAHCSFSEAKKWRALLSSQVGGEE